MDAAAGAVTARVPETYQWLLVPVQSKPQDAMGWHADKADGAGHLGRCEPARGSRTRSTWLQPWVLRDSGWRWTRYRYGAASHVTVRQVVEDFALYPYLPRLKDSSVVLLTAIADGVGLLNWQQDSFAFGESYDEEAQRYRGLRGRAGDRTP